MLRKMMKLLLWHGRRLSSGDLTAPVMDDAGASQQAGRGDGGSAVAGVIVLLE